MSVGFSFSCKQIHRLFCSGTGYSTADAAGYGKYSNYIISFVASFYLVADEDQLGADFVRFGDMPLQCQPNGLIDGFLGKLRKGVPQSCHETFTSHW